LTESGSGSEAHIDMTLTEDLLRVDVTVRVGRSRAVGMLRYVPKLDYPLMYLKDIR